MIYNIFMKKLFVLLLLTLGLINTSFGNSLDEWSNDNLCGWMESSSIPRHILDEVNKREILCYGGIEVSSLPESDSYESVNGTVFASPDPSLIPESAPDTSSVYSY